VILVVTSLHLGASTEGAGELSEEDTNIVTEHTGVPALKRQRQGSWLIGLTSFLFILLQSACTAVMAISGLRLLIGLGSLFAFYNHWEPPRLWAWVDVLQEWTKLLLRHHACPMKPHFNRRDTDAQRFCGLLDAEGSDIA